MKGAGVLLAPLAALGIGVRALAAVLKLYRAYFAGGKLGAMWRKKFGKG